MKHLVVHIGTGKTGSTAIQAYLRKNKLENEKAGVYYWGLNLEHAPITTEYGWRKPDGIGILQRMPEADACREVTAGLMEALLAAEDNSLIVWSNESIYEKPGIFIPAILSSAVNAPVEIKAIAYARNVRSYLRSAYTQWGIKHKTYTGKIKGFKEWTQGSLGFLSYGQKLQKWHFELKSRFDLVNYDSVDNVVNDFRLRAGLVEKGVDIPSVAREYSSPSDIHLALFALYNNSFTQPVLPRDVSNLLKHNKCNDGDYTFSDLTRILPAESDLDELTQLLVNELEILNSILSEKNQPLLQPGNSDIKHPLPDRLDMIEGTMSLLVRLVVRLNERITILEQKD